MTASTHIEVRQRPCKLGGEYHGYQSLPSWLQDTPEVGVMSTEVVMKNLNERIKFIYSSLFQDRHHFAKTIEVSYSQVGNILRGECGISSLAKKILETQYGVNIEWLDTGKGKPFIQPYAIQDNNCQIVSEPSAQPYGTDPSVSQLLALFAHLDPSDRDRLLQEAKDRLLLKQIREREGRTRDEQSGQAAPAPHKRRKSA